MADKSRRGLAVQKECVPGAPPFDDFECLSLAEMVAALAGAIIELRMKIAALERHAVLTRLQMRDDVIRIPCCSSTEDE